MIKKISQYTAAALTTAAASVFAASPVQAQLGSALGDGNIQPDRGFAPDISSVISAVLSFVMVIAGLLVLLYLIWGGIEWITSGGDKGKTESARNKITAAVIGIIILAASYAIFLLVINFLGFNNVQDLFNTAEQIGSST